MDIKTAIEYQPEKLEWALPQPDAELEETKDGRWGLIRKIPVYMMEEDKHKAKEFLFYEWRRAYQQAMLHITKQIIGRKEYFVFRFFPKLVNDYREDFCVNLELSWDIFAAPTKNIVIPEFTYIDNHPVEWKCGACTSPNEIKERHCTQCGSPRALLIQEMRNSSGEALW